MTNYNINIPDELWEKFKKTVDKSITMNDAIIKLIRGVVEEEVSR